MALFWIILIAVMAGAAYYGYSKRKSLLDSGQIANRKAGFEEYAEIFTLKEIPFSEIWEAMRNADYFSKANLYVNKEKEAIQFRGADWTAQMYHMKEEDSRNAYCFEFLNWRTHNGMAYEILAMNTVLTTVEKTFLKLDSNTQVSSKKIAIQTRPKFF